MRKGTITAIALLAICVGCGPVANGIPRPSTTPAAPPWPDIGPSPTATASVSPVAPTSTPTTTSRRIPLHRSDAGTTEGEDGQLLYRLVEQGEVWGDVVADHLSEDEMMCVQHLDLSPSPVRCVCWMGPLENAGVRGEGLHGMRRIVILSGSAEEAALALIEDWSPDIRDTSGREPCTADHLTISYDGGVFKPEPFLRPNTNDNK